MEPALATASTRSGATRRRHSASPTTSTTIAAVTSSVAVVGPDFSSAGMTGHRAT